MPIKVQIKKDSLNSSEDVKVHFIPASIDGNTTIKLEEYFNSYAAEEGDGKLLSGYCQD